MSLCYNRVTVQFSRLRFMLLKGFYSKIIIGAGGIGAKGYLKTEQGYLDVEFPLGLHNLQEIISEHVWEHLDFPSVATVNCYNALGRFGRLVVSVPHPRFETPETFIKWGHKTIFTTESLSKLFTTAGFKEVRELTGNRNIFHREAQSIIIEGTK